MNISYAEDNKSNVRTVLGKVARSVALVLEGLGGGIVRAWQVWFPSRSEEV